MRNTFDRIRQVAAQLAERIQQLKLNPERIAPVHGRVVPYRNLLIAFDLGAPTATR